jgi:hypothetical protein
MPGHALADRVWLPLENTHNPVRLLWHTLCKLGPDHQSMNSNFEETNGTGLAVPVTLC